jgi:hypothetical protein
MQYNTAQVMQGPLSSCGQRCNGKVICASWRSLFESMHRRNLIQCKATTAAAYFSSHFSLPLRPHRSPGLQRLTKLA